MTLGLALIAGVLALVHLPLLFGQVYFYRDVGRWLYPARVFLRQALAAGESPLYHPGEGLGLALAASPLHGIFYPPSWWPALGLSEARALSLVVFAHVLWGAAGMLLLAARFGLPRAAAVVAALGWALSGPITAAITAGQLLPASSWFPWCALGAIGLAARLRGSRRQLAAGVAGAALPAAAALLLGEVFQAALAVAFGAAVAVVWDRFVDGPGEPAGTAYALAGDVPATGAQPGTGGRRRALRAALGALTAVVLAGALAAVMLLPLQRALGETERGAGLSRAVAEKWSMHPLRLFELVAPGAMGDPYGAYPGGQWAGDGASDDRPLLYGVYLGAALTLLAAAGLRGRRALWGLGALVVLAVVLALGRHTPLHALLRTLVPLFAYQRAPEKFILAAPAALALLAGCGARRVQDDPRVLTAPGLALGGALLLLQLGPMVWPAQRVMFTLAAGGRHGLLAVAGLVAAAWLQRHWSGRSRLGVALVPAVVALDLGLSAMALLVFAPASVLDETPALATLAQASHHGPGRPRVVRDPSVEGALGGLARGRGLVHLEALRYASLRPAFLTAHGLATLPGYDAGLPPALEEVWRRGQPRALALMRLLAVDFVVLPVPADRRGLPGLTLLGTPGPPGIGLFRVNAPLPRAYVAPSAAPMRADDAVTTEPPRLFADDVVAGATVLLADGAPSAPPADARAWPCSIAEYHHTRIAARCDSPTGGHAVFVEQFGSGWTATVDGAPAPIVRANRLMRAVPVASGNHQVVLTYQQPGLAGGAAISGMALLMVVGGMVMGWRERQGPR
jgi:hypothetical protein